jgi:hypothetical protein
MCNLNTYVSAGETGTSIRFLRRRSAGSTRLRKEIKVKFMYGLLKAKCSETSE